MEPRRWNQSLTGILVVLAGILIGQAVLYGPSLVGRKILLPLDILAYPGFYLPRTPQVASLEVQNIYAQDLVCLFEPGRRFAAAEVRAGRWPMWMPTQFGGVPFSEPKFSPFLAPQFCTASPVILAWTQLLAALVAGLGAYLFFRRALGVSFWPATIAAWCYPLTGFFIFWQGYQTGNSVYWLPWLLLAVERTARGAGGLGPIGLGVVTCLVLVSGHLDVAAQVLAVSGGYGLWCLHDSHPRQWCQRPARKALLALVAAWALGLLLAAPQVLPLLDYTRTGMRMARRTAGQEERPPVGLTALPQTVLPDMYGAYGVDKTGSFRLVPDNQIESTAAGYAGVVATLFLAPLAWCDPRQRARNIFWVAISLFGLSWCLNVPGIVHLLRLPGLNLMSHGRLVFIVCFAALTLAAIGLDALWHGQVQWRRWFWAPTALLAGLCGWCAYRTVLLPEPIATGLEQAVEKGQPLGWVHTLEAVRRVQAWFVVHYAVAAGLCAIGVAGWLVLRFHNRGQRWLVPAAGIILLADLLWFAYGRNVQCDPALYFPPVPVLEEVARSAPGRVAGYFCLPANLASSCGLSDLRGYDGIDPARMVELVTTTAGPRVSAPRYAFTQYLVPRATPTPEGGVRLPPVMDMLGVRYVIFRGEPSTGARPVFQGADYWVLVNSNALDRVFVPQRVEAVTNNEIRLSKMASDQFNPREVAYVESPVELPSLCRGTAAILEENPIRIRVAVRMETSGLVVLADRWDKGWRAYLDGKPVAILPTNHAIRGVLVPPGPTTLEFRYEPASFAWGLRLGGMAGLTLLAWFGWAGRRLRRASCGLETPAA